MIYNVSAEEIKNAKQVHELLLVNLVGNHILCFVAALGVAGSFWQPLLAVPVFSLSVLTYIIFRARAAKHKDSWFVMCHWQLAAQRSRFFLIVLSLLLVACVIGWVAYSQYQVGKIMVLALIGGVGLLPVLVSVLILIIAESDALHQASQGKISDRFTQLFPDGIPAIIPEAEAVHQE